MNKEIAAQDRWGRTEILNRGRQLAERMTTIWPGPLDVTDDDAGIRWDLVNRALRELPAGVVDDLRRSRSPDRKTRAGRHAIMTRPT